jgi:hypothetical protein
MFSVLGGTHLLCATIANLITTFDCQKPLGCECRRRGWLSASAGVVNPTAEIAAADWSVFISGFSGILSLLSSSSWDAPEADMA